MSHKEGDGPSSLEDLGVAFDLSLKEEAGARDTQIDRRCARQKEQMERLENGGLRTGAMVGRV